MALTAQSIVKRVVDTLQDHTSVRWTIPELCRYFNDAQREVILFRPDASNKNMTHTCVAGAKQELPTDGAKLIDVVRNSAAGTNNAAITSVPRALLDVQIPNWYGLTEATKIMHYTYDPRDPTVFYVYPPATIAARLEIAYSAYPTDIAIPAEGTTYTDVTGDLDLPDIYGNVVADYILYRAYTKDSEHTANAQRAVAHYQTFSQALGIEIKGTTGVAPQIAPQNVTKAVPVTGT